MQVYSGINVVACEVLSTGFIFPAGSTSSVLLFSFCLEDSSSPLGFSSEVSKAMVQKLAILLNLEGEIFSGLGYKQTIETSSYFVVKEQPNLLKETGI